MKRAKELGDSKSPCKIDIVFAILQQPDFTAKKKNRHHLSVMAVNL